MRFTAGRLGREARQAVEVAKAKRRQALRLSQDKPPHFIPGQARHGGQAWDNASSERIPGDLTMSETQSYPYETHLYNYYKPLQVIYAQALAVPVTATR